MNRICLIFAVFGLLQMAEFKDPESSTTAAAATLGQCFYGSGVGSKLEEVSCDFGQDFCYILMDVENSSSFGCSSNSSVSSLACINDSSTFCCRESNCNNPTATAFKSSSMLFTDESEVSKEEFGEKPWLIVLLCFSSVLSSILTGMIVAIIWIIHTLYCQTYDQKKQDDRLLTKIEFRKKEVVEKNRRIAHLNLQVAIKELYYFLEQKRLIKSSVARRKRRPQKHEDIVVKIKIRSPQELEKRLKRAPHLNESQLPSN